MVKLTVDKNYFIAWSIFILFSLLLFTKCLIFHWEVYHSFLVSSILTDPLRFWSFWLPKLGISVFFASFVFFSKRDWWTIALSIVIDTWILANMFYLRSNGILFNGFTFTMAANMDGFWSSILALFTWQDVIPFAVTILYSIAIYFVAKHKERYIKSGCVVLCFSILFNWYIFGLVNQFAAYTLRSREENKECHSTFYYMKDNPFSYEYRRGIEQINMDYAFYNFSVIHALFFISQDNLYHYHEMSQPCEITNEEQISQKLQVFGNRHLEYDNLLIIIVVESLESWTITDSVMPHLYKFISSHPILYAKYLKSQIVGGFSSDGQLIINTGLLPIRQGAVCFRYPYITFPSIVNRKDSAVTILTHGATSWNQNVMSQAYGYDMTIEGNVEDSILSQRIIDYSLRGYRSIQGITVASHIPFSYANRSSLQLPNDMPVLMKNYLKCLNWTDAGLGYLLDRVDSIPELKDATIVITGDHTIFWKEKRDEFENYCLQTNQSYDVAKEFVPLVVYSPKSITKKLVLDDVNYQMDIYPTILGALNVNDYYWKGFGVNMLDSISRQNRKFTEMECYSISDELIRGNYFSTR